MTRKRKIIIISAAILAFFIIIVLWARGCKQTLNLVYEYDKVSMGPVEKTVSVTGTIDLLESVRILSNVDGIVQKVYVDYNQNIKKGQMMAKIDAGDLNLRLQKTKKQLEKAQLDLLGIKKEYEGKKSLFKENLISENALQLGELEYKKALTTVKQIELDYQSLREQQNSTRVYSPIYGMVMSKEIEEGYPIGVNKLMFTIARTLKKMKLVISIDESDIGYMKKGQRVTFNVSAYPDKKFDGKIDQVRFNPINKGGVISYESVVICNNSDLLLKPGMTATATVLVEEKKKVLRVANDAFVVSPVDVDVPAGKKFIWKKKDVALGDLPVEHVEVKTGLVGDFYTEITSKNIKKGDKVLVRLRKKVDVKDEIDQYGK
ncbi:MAG: efflux RND transporter periplasmic adaptor subunit [Bacteroidota bacterium]